MLPPAAKGQLELVWALLVSFSTLLKQAHFRGISRFPKGPPPTLAISQEASFRRSTVVFVNGCQLVSLGIRP